MVAVFEKSGGSDSTRRSVLKKAAVAGGLVWAAPVVESLVLPAAATSGGPIESVLYKGSASPGGVPTLDQACTGSYGTGNTDRGTVSFTRSENGDGTSTITVEISVQNPTINGDGCCPGDFGCVDPGREVLLFAADGSVSCITPTGKVGTPSCFTAPANTVQQFTFSLPSDSTAEYFSVRLLESGGGGTDNYWSFPLASLP